MGPGLNVALLAGGTGGAKLAVGLRDILHGFGGEPADTPGQLDVIANTADDIEIYGVHVSPDPDLITFRLAGVLNAAGYGIEGESHTHMDKRRAAGEEIWFELGDEDLAVCARRAALLVGDAPLTEAHAEATIDYDTGGARVLPMSDDPVGTVVISGGEEIDIQQFLIKLRGSAPIETVRFEGVDEAEPSEQVLAAIARADLIVVGPSNPAISVLPILAVPGMSDAIRERGVPVVGVSPIVGGEVLKGPTAAFAAAAGFDATPTGIADWYESLHPGLIDAWVADEPVTGHAHHLMGVAMTDPEQTRIVAGELLRYARSVSR